MWRLHSNLASRILNLHIKSRYLPQIRYSDFNFKLDMSFSVELRLQMQCHVYYAIQIKNFNL